MRKVDYNIEFVDRNTTIYREGDHILTFVADGGGPGHVIVYFEKVVAWDPPHEAEKLGPEDKERIRTNLRSAYASEGMKIEFDDEGAAP